VPKIGLKIQGVKVSVQWRGLGIGKCIRKCREMNEERIGKCIRKYKNIGKCIRKVLRNALESWGDVLESIGKCTTARAIN
jgi:hypothetical protein